MLNTDSQYYGGAGVGNLGAVRRERSGWHEQPFSADGHRAAARGRLAAPVERRAVAGLEEGRDRAGRAGDHDHRPDLESDVDDPTTDRERVADLGRHGQELHGREEERVAEAVDVAAAQWRSNA